MSNNPGLFSLEPSREPFDPTDEGLSVVEQWFRSQKDMAARLGQAIRTAFDEVLDGQRTGRFDIDLLEKTEKTYLGTKIEIIVRAEFDLSRGHKIDYLVAGHGVDAKFTIGDNWAIPQEAHNQICLLLKATDKSSAFSAGLLRIGPMHLNRGQNKDGKRSISLVGKRATRWLAQNEPLPQNLLLHLSKTDLDAIFRASEGSGQLRIDELLRRVNGCIIDRTTVETVARQLDPAKRIRDARIRLRKDGIVVLGHEHGHQARGLHLPVPRKGSWVAARLVAKPPGDERASVEINGCLYVIAHADEPMEPGPMLPRSSSRED